NLAVDPATGLQSGDTVTVRWDTVNAGATQANGSFTDLITVTNATTGEVLTEGAVYYDAAANGPLAAGASQPQQFTFRLPAGASGAGDIRVTVTTDYYDEIGEDNADGTAEANNDASVTVTSALAPYPDLQVRNLTVNPSTGLHSGDT